MLKHNIIILHEFHSHTHTHKEDIYLPFLWAELPEKTVSPLNSLNRRLQHALQTSTLGRLNHFYFKYNKIFKFLIEKIAFSHLKTNATTEKGD